MVKKKKKDPETKARLRAQKDAKQDKAASKRLNKSQLKDGGENVNDVDDLDALLASFAASNNISTSLVVEEVRAISPRANFSATVVGSTGSSCEFWIFGGEFYDGAVNLVYDGTYWDIRLLGQCELVL